MSKQLDLAICKERVASGLRAMYRKPDYLLFCDSDVGDWIWDEPEILGIPVLHSAFVSNTYNDDRVPWIPLWQNWHVDLWLDRSRFCDAYWEFQQEVLR